MNTIIPIPNDHIILSILMPDAEEFQKYLHSLDVKCDLGICLETTVNDRNIEFSLESLDIYTFYRDRFNDWKQEQLVSEVAKIAEDLDINETNEHEILLKR